MAEFEVLRYHGYGYTGISIIGDRVYLTCMH